MQKVVITFLGIYSKYNGEISAIFHPLCETLTRAGFCMASGAKMRVSPIVRHQRRVTWLWRLCASFETVEEET